MSRDIEKELLELANKEVKDEIKEILDRLKDSVDNPIDTEVDQFTEEAYDIPNYFCLDPTTNDCKVLLDYITNLQEKRKYDLCFINHLKEDKKHLQEENERLKENVIHNDKVVDKGKWQEMIYKSRIEKAINHINKHQLVYISQYKEMSCFDNHLMDILQGLDKDV